MGEYPKARVSNEEAIRIYREVGEYNLEVITLANLSGCLIAMEDTEAAIENAHQALNLSRKIGFINGEAWVQTYLGHSLLAEGALDPAGEAYTEAIAIRGKLNQPVLAAEPAAGLARVALRKGDLATARDAIKPVLDHLEGGGSLEGCNDPLLIYLTSYQVLAQAGDPRATPLLETAYRQMQDRAAKILNEQSRASFLNMAHHIEIRQAWEKLHPKP
jgi:tetratricopeptide (TPR) repeat protein